MMQGVADAFSRHCCRPAGLAHDAEGVRRGPGGPDEGRHRPPLLLDTGGRGERCEGLGQALVARGDDVSVLAPGEDGDVAPYARAGRRGRAGALQRARWPGCRSGRSSRPGCAVAQGGPVSTCCTPPAGDPQHRADPRCGPWSGRWSRPSTSNVRSRAMSASAAILRPSMEKIDRPDRGVGVRPRHPRARHRRRAGGDPATASPTSTTTPGAEPREEWRGPVDVAFVGRIDEPRKGFGLLAEAFARLAADRPGSGCSWWAAATSSAPVPACPPGSAARSSSWAACRTPTRPRAAHRRRLRRPQHRGESFGIVLVEAMAAGATVLASDIPAFAAVLNRGRYGELFRSEDVDDLSARLRRCSTTPTVAPRWTRPRPRACAATTGPRWRPGSCRSTRPSPGGGA